MRWSSRYNTFALGVTAGVLALLGFLSITEPLTYYLVMEALNNAFDEDLHAAWILTCITFAVVWSLYRQLWLDRRPRKGYKEDDQP